MIHGKVSSTPAPAFLAGGGEMGALMRAHDWSATLGPVEAWPQALRQALGICLNAQHPIGIYWGEQRRLLYNDAWRRLIGEKHPGALGAPAGEVFPEAWPSIEPALTEVFATGVAAGSAEDLLPQRLDGQLEDRWFDFSLNPIIGTRGASRACSASASRSPPASWPSGGRLSASSSTSASVASRTPARSSTPPPSF
jgi:hypothetical protein